MIITAEQLRAINEVSVAPSVVYANDTTTPGVTAAVKSANNTGNTFSVKTPGTGGTVSATLPELENGIDLKNASKVEVTKDPSKQETSIMESRYSKRQVELGRMLEMRSTGKVYSKKQLNEMFFETQDNTAKLKEIIGGCNLFTIFQAADILAPDGEDRLKEAYMSGADLEMVLDELFSSADPSKQEEFLGALRS